MTSGIRPTYPNPTIQEALCEIHFRLKDEATWNASWYGDYYKAVEDQFPTIIPISAPQLRFDIGQPSTPTPLLVVPQIMRYQNADETVLLQLSENRLVINVLQDYPGWRIVSEHIRYAWDKVCKVIEPASVWRIGVRYINLIERRAPGEALGEWLRESEFVPRAVLTSHPGFLSRVEVQLDEQAHLKVTVSDRGVRPEGNGAFILDIDQVTEKDVPVDGNLLLAEVTTIHDLIWDVFSALKTERLEQLLQGEIL